MKPDNDIANSVRLRKAGRWLTKAGGRITLRSCYYYAYETCCLLERYERTSAAHIVAYASVDATTLSHHTAILTYHHVIAYGNIRYVTRRYYGIHTYKRRRG